MKENRYLTCDILERPQHVSDAIVGASRPEQLEDNAKAVDVKLDARLMAKINELLDPSSKAIPRRSNRSKSASNQGAGGLTKAV